MLCKFKQQPRTNANQAQSRARLTPFASNSTSVSSRPQQPASRRLSLATLPAEFTSTNCPRPLGLRAQSEERCSSSKPSWPTALREALRPRLCFGWRRASCRNTWNHRTWWRSTASSSTCDQGLKEYASSQHWHRLSLNCYSLSINILLFNKVWFRKSQSEVLDIIVAHSNQWNR